MAFASLTIDLNARLANIERDMGKMAHVAEKEGQRMQAAFARVGASVAALGVGLGIGGLAAFVKSSIDAADNLNDLSKKTGVAVEQLAGFDLAARSSGTSLEDIGGAMGKLNKTMGEAAGGNKEAAAMLEALGVTAKKPEEALYQLADAFGRMGSEGDKARAFSAVLGKSWQNLAPLLSEGGDGLRALVEEGKRLNPVTQEMAANADKFNDSLERLKARAGGVGIAIANDLLPSMNKMFTDMEAGTRIFGSFGNALLKIGLQINPFDSVADGLAKYRAEVKRLQQLQAGSRGEVAAMLEPQVEEAKRKLEWYKHLQQQEALALNDKFGTGAYKQARVPALPNIKLPGLGASGGAKAKADKLDTIDPFGKQRAAAEAEVLRRAVDEQNAAYDALAATRDEQIEQDEKAAASLGRVREAMLDILDPVQKYRDELAKVDGLVDAGLFTPEQAAAARLYWNEQMDAAAGFGKVLRDDVGKSADIAKELGMTFSSAFEDAIVAGKEFSDILDGIAKDITRIFIRKAVTEPIAAGLGDIFKGFDLGAIFGGGKASGGPVDAGRAYLVGEKGPELFVPPASGNIVPNNQLGGGRSVVINMNVSAQDAGSFRKSMGQIKADLAFAVSSAGRNL